jgi:hypothetical protein
MVEPSSAGSGERPGWAFVSYARSDEVRVSPIVEYLESTSVDVWWDKDLQPGDRWAYVLREKLDNAACVVVAWSTASVSSGFVNAEIQKFALDHGWNLGRLVPLLLDAHAASEIPVPYNSLQYQDLTQWDGRSQDVLHAVASRVSLLVSRPPNRTERWRTELVNDGDVDRAIQASRTIGDLSSQVGSVAQVLLSRSGPAADTRATLDEIHRTLTVVSAAIEEFVAAGLDPAGLDPRPFARFERGTLAQRIRDGKGHCDLIALHYAKPRGIRDWLRVNAPLDIQGVAEETFKTLSEADSDLFELLASVGDVLTSESRKVVNLVIAGQTEEAQRLVFQCREKLAPLEAELGTSIRTLQEVEQRLGFATTT